MGPPHPAVVARGASLHLCRGAKMAKMGHVRGSPYGPSPAQPSTAVVTYTPKAKHKSKVRRGAAGIPLNA